MTTAKDVHRASGANLSEGDILHPLIQLQQTIGQDVRARLPHNKTLGHLKALSRCMYPCQRKAVMERTKKYLISTETSTS